MVSTLWIYYRVASDRNKLCEWLLACFEESRNTLNDLTSERLKPSQFLEPRQPESEDIPTRMLPLTYMNHSYLYLLWASVQKSKGWRIVFYPPLLQSALKGSRGQLAQHGQRTNSSQRSRNHSEQSRNSKKKKKKKGCITRILKSSRGNLIKNYIQLSLIDA